MRWIKRLELDPCSYSRYISDDGRWEINCFRRGWDGNEWTLHYRTPGYRRHPEWTFDQYGRHLFGGATRMCDLQEMVEAFERGEPLTPRADFASNTDSWQADLYERYARRFAQRAMARREGR